MERGVAWRRSAEERRGAKGVGGRRCNVGNGRKRKRSVGRALLLGAKSAVTSRVETLRKSNGETENQDGKRIVRDVRKGVGRRRRK